MTTVLTINIHEEDEFQSKDIDRRHYTVAQLIAELKAFDGDTPIVIKKLNRAAYCSIDFSGVSVEVEK